MNTIIVWIGLIIISLYAFIEPSIPNWLPGVLWMMRIVFRWNEIICNYLDWLKICKRNEKLKFKKIGSQYADRGLYASGERKQKQLMVKEDFKYERKQKQRKFYVELVETLFLK